MSAQPKTLVVPELSVRLAADPRECFSMQQVMQHTFVVDTNRERAWSFLWDVEAVAKCIPGCEEVTTQEPGVSYRARVRRSVGPFLIRFELTIAVTETVPLQRLQALVSGEDKRLRSSVEQKIEISLEEISHRQVPDSNHYRFSADRYVGCTG